MRPEVEYLLARCGLSSQREEYVNHILSMNASQLTERLAVMMRSAQESSPLFRKLKRDQWYLVAPPTPADPPRCLRGEVFMMADISFPDFSPPPANCSKKEREEFERRYVYTFLEKVQYVQNYKLTLERAHEFCEVRDGLLEHAADFLLLNIHHARQEHDRTGASDARMWLSHHIERMTQCLQALQAEQKRRFEEKGSP